MGVTIDTKDVLASGVRSRGFDRPGLSVRVRLDGLDRHASANAVISIVEVLPDIGGWQVAPTADGTLLVLNDRRTAMSILTDLTERLTAEGLDGKVFGCSDSFSILNDQSNRARPIPASAALAYTIDPPYQDGPFNKHGIVDYRWGVPHEITVACARDWVDWAVPLGGPATLYPALVDVSPEDALDLLVPEGEGAQVHCQLLGAPTGSTVTRIVTAGHFGAVMLTETGSGKAPITQALEMTTESLLPHAAYVDYATVRLARPNATRWFAAGDIGDEWNFYIRHLWSHYVADPNGIQILTDSHLEKAQDLTTNWDVTPAAPGRWLVRAKDLTPWFETVDLEQVTWQQQFVHEDVLDQARRDFGDMVLSFDDACSRRLRGPHMP